MRRRSIFAIILTLLALAPTAASAQWRRPHFGGGVQRLDRILPGIRARQPGRFYDAEGPFRDAAGGMHYRLKWLTPEGRVIWLDTDARTGRVIGPAGAPPPGGRLVPMPPGPPEGQRYPPPGWGNPGYGGWPHP